MRTGPKLVGLALVAVSVISCSSPPANTGTSADTQARAVARGTVETLETVWMTSAKMCMAVAESKADQAIADDCKNYLTPAREAIIGAADAVDAWDAAAQGNFPCLIASALDGLNNAMGVATSAGLTVPQVVKDGQILAGLYAPKCVKTDAGTKG